MLVAAGSGHENDRDVYADAKRKFDYYGGQIDFSGKSVLDVGCGDGKKTAYFSTMSSETVAIDLVRQFIVLARDFARNCDLMAHPDFVVADSAHLPFRNGYFQVVISNDLMEHVADYTGTILEMERVAAPMGYVCIDFGPLWRSPFGAHLDTLGGLDWFSAPWLHTIFPAESVKGMLIALGKMKESDGRSSLFRSLNKISIEGFETILSGAKLKTLVFRLLSPSPLQIFSKTALREYTTYRVVSLLQKNDHSAQRCFS